nr:hypothetical protein [Luteibacter rhizovicinus]
MFGIFWCLVGIALLFIAHKSAVHIRFEQLSSGLAAYLQTAGILCLIAGGFCFLTTDWQAVVSDATPSSSTLSMLGWTVAAFAVPILAGMTFAGISRRRKVKRDEIDVQQFTVSLDRPNGVVRITERGAIAVRTVPVGHLIVDVAPYETEGQKRAQVTLREWPKDPTLSPATAAGRVVNVLRSDVYATPARDLEAWLHHHPGVPANPDRFNREWRAGVDALVRYCRQQRSVGGAPVVELWSATNGPSVSYLAIEKDGRVFGGVGEHPALESITTPLLSDGGRQLGFMLGNARPLFSMTDDQVKIVQKMHGKGLLSIAVSRD